MVTPSSGTERTECPRSVVLQSGVSLYAWRMVTAALAPIVALVLLGLVKVQHDTSEWVYWKAELIFLTVLEIAYGMTLFLSVLGTLVLSLLVVPGVGRKTNRLALRTWANAMCCPPVGSGDGRSRLCRLDLVVPSLDVRVRRRPRNRRTLKTLPAVRTPAPASQSPLEFLRPSRRPRDRSGRYGRSMPREFPTTTGCRSARSSPGSSKNRFRAADSSRTSSPGRAIPWKCSTRSSAT